MTGLTVDGWDALRRRISSDAIAEKDSQGALFALFEVYRRLDTADRAVVERWMGREALLGEEVDRFDAIAMIREFRVVSALAGLRQLEERLMGSDSPGAPFERAKVGRLIAYLERGSRDGGG